MKITKTFEVAIEVDTEEVAEMKNGKVDWDAYPNWDINYLGEEERFIEGVMDEVKKYNQYSGIIVRVDEKK